MMLDLTKYKGHSPKPWKWLIEKDDLFTQATLFHGKYPHYEKNKVLGCNSVTCECESKVPSKADRKLIEDAPLLLAEVEELRAALSDLVKAIEISEGHEREDLHTWTAFKTAKHLINGTNNGL